MCQCTQEFVCYLPQKFPNFGTCLKKEMKIQPIPYALAVKNLIPT